jgi:hypothetical protein
MAVCCGKGRVFGWPSAVARAGCSDGGLLWQGPDVRVAVCCGVPPTVRVAIAYEEEEAEEAEELDEDEPPSRRWAAAWWELRAVIAACCAHV